MTGISLDLFTVILLVLLAFTWGYHAGHRYGRNEVRDSINSAIGGFNKIFEDQAKKMEEVRKQMMENKSNPRGFLELLNQLGEDMKKIRVEQAEDAAKEKDGDE